MGGTHQRAWSRDLALPTLTFGLLALCFGCSARYGRLPEAPSAGRLPDSVHWVRNSAEHRAAFLQTYRLATRQLERLAAGRPPGSWAVITDADGGTHNWREDLCRVLLSKQARDGSWVNEADRWYEGNPHLVTAYAILALQEALGDC